jgi:MoaA/NifB/PqqE/SkfB family radical SAM enzyme
VKPRLPYLDEKLQAWLDRFRSAPLLVFWETTKACPLACRHCRATAISTPLPGELTTKEGSRLTENIATFGDPKPFRFDREGQRGGSASGSFSCRLIASDPRRHEGS